jgi:hypothetical protein
MKKKSFFILIGLFFIGCPKKTFYTHTGNGAYKGKTQCDSIKAKVRYIESQSIEAYSGYSLATENRLYKGLKRCRDIEEQGSKDYIEYERLMNVINNMINEADELIREGKRIHMQ